MLRIATSPSELTYCVASCDTVLVVPAAFLVPHIMYIYLYLCMWSYILPYLSFVMSSISVLSLQCRKLER